MSPGPGCGRAWPHEPPDLALAASSPYTEGYPLCGRLYLPGRTPAGRPSALLKAPAWRPTSQVMSLLRRPREERVRILVPRVATVGAVVVRAVEGAAELALV